MSQTSRKEGISLVDEWRSSGLSSTEYCKQSGIPVHRLYYWRTAIKKEKDSDESSSNKFIPIKLSNKTNSSSSPTVEVVTPSGCTIKFYGEVNWHEISKVIW